jgi:hypothetical protein
MNHNRYVGTVGRRDALWIVTTSVGETPNDGDAAAIAVLAHRYGVPANRFVITTMTSPNRKENR